MLTDDRIPSEIRRDPMLDMTDRSKDSAILRRLMGSLFKDAELNRQFVDDGFVVVPFLDGTEIAHLRRFFDDLHPDKLSAFYPSLMNPDAEYKKANYEAVRAVFGPKIAATFNGYRPIMPSFSLKEPGQTVGEVPMHVDPSFVHENEFTSINLWVPLTDVAADSGCLQVVPGSHHHGFPLRPLTEQGTIGHPFGSVMPLLKA